MPNDTSTMLAGNSSTTTIHHLIARSWLLHPLNGHEEGRLQLLLLLVCFGRDWWLPSLCLASPN